MVPNLRAAYAPFRASLLAGGFHDPAPGEWSAAHVAAHVARGNELIAAAAEATARGDVVEFDNAVAVEDAELARYAEEAGDLRGLAERVDESAVRLEAAYQSLGDRADVEVHARMRDRGVLRFDGPMAIGELIEGNAGFHLAAHHEQLAALAPEWVSDPPAEFDTYQLVMLVRAANPPELDDATADEVQRRHLGHFAKLRAAGLLAANGPIRGHDPIAGVSIYTAASVEEARALAEDDPAVRIGRFEIEAVTWFTRKGALVTDPTA